ncbi:ATP-dependent DNA helicase [Mycena chlorophos]|uniref:ATP-dependent DNA helicase n=1 Tax=Mycena chlorophos TaxID=658473 RepID=A0A8H6SWY6_MYCCL|nr:ATP-dependent DNA helicase [Mycena chlorophos]
MIFRIGTYWHPPTHILLNNFKTTGSCFTRQPSAWQPHSCANTAARISRLELAPPLSLANNMWIGSVPFVLEILTLPEKLLIALYFPAAYVVKLFPKRGRHTKWNEETINSGMRGNVSTYRLNTKDIADMVTGNLMPRPIGILAAVVSVTFVGAKNLPLLLLPEMFDVRRQRVLDALTWLKANNDVYRHIEISRERLEALPEAGVPDSIRLNAHYAEDASILDREHSGYVPVDLGDDSTSEDERIDEAEERADQSAPEVLPPQANATENLNGPEWEEFDPVVIPLQAHGTIDVSGETITDSELFAHAAQNLLVSSTPSGQREFLVRRGNSFVSEYPRTRNGDPNGERFAGEPGDANHMLGAFPTLFPYGRGGIEVDRDITVSYRDHVRWALEYGDGRFRRDFHFVFQAFGVLQRHYFSISRAAFLRLRPAHFHAASQEEAQKRPISNPVIRALRQQLTSVRARVQGTDESRISIRAQVWGMTLRYNPPSIWATINLSDTGDPIAQVLAGVEIDLDRFVASAGPNSTSRSKTIAADPFAAAQFFHETVNVILQELFGITATVNGYIGTVEAQARGTLHLHILIWLEGAPTATMMRDALKSEEFRAKMRTFIRQNIRAHIRGTTGADVLDIPVEPNIAYSRPEDPRLPNHEVRAAAAERRIARAVQPHDSRTLMYDFPSSDGAERGTSPSPDEAWRAHRLPLPAGYNAELVPFDKQPFIGHLEREKARLEAQNVDLMAQNKSLAEEAARQRHEIYALQHKLIQVSERLHCRHEQDGKGTPEEQVSELKRFLGWMSGEIRDGIHGERTRETRRERVNQVPR